MPTAEQNATGQRDSSDPLPSSKLDAVKAAAEKVDQPDTITPVEAAMATEWFLSDKEEEVAWAWLPVNVAAAGAPEKIVQFKIQVVDRDKIRALRRESEFDGPNGREINELEANAKIVVEGLLEPNLRDEQFRTVRGQRFLDPVDALRARFAHKPGLIDQIAGRIVEISGYNERDVKEIQAAKG